MNARILIVDDNPDIVAMLEDRLHASGYETVIARAGNKPSTRLRMNLRTSY